MFISFLITTATFLPLIAHLTYAVSVVQGAPQALNSPPSDLYPDPQPCYGNCSWVHDPSIVYENGTYWRFSTSGNIAIATAPSLSGPWTYQGTLLSNGTKIYIQPDQDIWAPSITKRGSTYYAHYSVSHITSHNSSIGVATSSSLFPGSWTDHGAIGLPQNDRYNLIDPFIYQDSPSAPTYLMFGSYWTGIQQVELNANDDNKDGNMDGLLFYTGNGLDIKNIISNTTLSPSVVEGATIYSPPSSNLYYIFFSVGKCCEPSRESVRPGDEYHVVVCRSDSITGPYFDRDGKNCLTENGGTTILASQGDVWAPGGQGVMWDERMGRDVMYYHYVRLSIGLEAWQFLFGWNYLDWRDGWPVVVAAEK